MARPRKVSFPSDEEFTNLYKTCSNDEIMSLLGITKTQLRYHVEQLGVNKDKNVVRENNNRKKSVKPSDEILRELAKKHTADEIGEIYGVSRHTVYLWFKVAGITKREAFAPDNDLFSKYTTSEIAEMYNVWPSTVCRYRQKHGLPMVKARRLPEDEELLILLQKHSPLEIAIMYDVSTAAISSRLKRMEKERR